MRCVSSIIDKIWITYFSQKKWLSLLAPHITCFAYISSNQRKQTSFNNVVFWDQLNVSINCCFYQGCIQNPIKNLRWSFRRQVYFRCLNGFSRASLYISICKYASCSTYFVGLFQTFMAMSLKIGPCRGTFWNTSNTDTRACVLLKKMTLQQQLSFIYPDIPMQHWKNALLCCDENCATFQGKLLSHFF